ncbi:hypothetical protein CLAFUW4_05258 [Fulvia fulva]|uniref:Uncharacterized protein n=1 Tax=Passalora fulva TaxID=5499 RepID=A0A9Q8LKD3_PASFU|nr:uncharacterized protein CLAFUR5_05406 [Fulvia fulva]KAK4623547.1 hypothetical protein CLAFUR4_05252 [Fulvia fulva]KAK4625413.1 hypothetical protein CLAFUR0_05259 [Fulvia fulva]UJO18338.1 hypothetical protein CLAFUR5_05406 [Fulvia fulva]WPV14904.1 hypothetical protein CLAFUW4_05258 [Fulvia fulva]WPV29847.1 hypothetical protein CLAFUW7_05257 [Fulvia fulva]
MPLVSNGCVLKRSGRDRIRRSFFLRILSLLYTPHIPQFANLLLFDLALQEPFPINTSTLHQPRTRSQALRHLKSHQVNAISSKQTMAAITPEVSAMRSTLTTQPESTPMLPGLRLQRDTQASDVIPASPAPTPDVEKPMSLIHALQRRKQTSHLDFSDDDGATQGLGTPRTSTFEPFEDNISPACTKADGEQNCPIHFPVNGGGLFTAKEYLQKA